MENNIQIPPFYVGQEVVANCDHSDGHFTKGEEFNVTSIEKTCCGWNITVGIIHKGSYRSECFICGSIDPVIRTGEIRYNSSRFSPKITIGEFISMREVADKCLEEVASN